MAVYLGEDLVNLFGGQPVSGSGPTELKKFVIRPDAEIVQSWSYDKYVIADEGKTKPSYSTSAQTLITYSNLSPTITLDSDYNYYVSLRYLAIPEYTSGTTPGTGYGEYFISSYMYEITDAFNFKSLVNSSKSASVTSTTVSQYFYRYIYWSNASTMSAYNGASYGVYMTTVVPTVSSGVLTVNSPYIRIRGNTTYLTETYFNAISDIRYQYKIEVYRSKKGELNYDGWPVSQHTNNAINNLENNNGKLT